MGKSGSLQETAPVRSSATSPRHHFPGARASSYSNPSPQPSIYPGAPTSSSANPSTPPHLHPRVMETPSANPLLNTFFFCGRPLVEYMKFTEYMITKGFMCTHTPKITPGVSEGGAAVFELDYFVGKRASLAQSPQLYKQMLLNGGINRVFEVGPVFRAEKSSTHRHLCEYIGLHAEMKIEEHYFEVMDFVGGLFVYLFKHLAENCSEMLDIIKEQYPCHTLKYLEQTLRLKYSEGIKMLRDSGFKIEELDDLSNEAEQKLGKLVLEKYDTDFFMLYEYPLALRPFYTMPSGEERHPGSYSNSFDAFIRGQEVLSGSQRIHCKELLIQRIKELKYDMKSFRHFTETFRCGAPPRGGFGAGLERIVALYLGLPDIRIASLFPRDPDRLFP